MFELTAAGEKTMIVTSTGIYDAGDYHRKEAPDVKLGYHP